MKRKKAGRTPSPEGRVTLNLTVPPYVAKRLKAAGNASATVKALVDADIARQQMADDTGETKVSKTYRVMKHGAVMLYWGGSEKGFVSFRDASIYSLKDARAVIGEIEARAYAKGDTPPAMGLDPVTSSTAVNQGAKHERS